MSIIPQETLFPQDVAYKQCNRCKQSLPATSEYYTRDRSKKDGWRTICRTCQKTPKEVLPPVPDGYKRCRTCQKVKLATTEFFNATATYASPDGLNRQCRECRNAYRKAHIASKPKTPLPQAEQKQCSTCGQFFPSTQEFFNLNRSTKDRLDPQCRTCSKLALKQYRDRPGGKEKRRAYDKAHSEEQRAYRRQYRQAHKEHERDYRRQYRRTHQEQIRTTRRTYSQREEVKQRRRIQVQNRMARRRADSAAHPLQETPYKECKGCQRLLPATTEYFHSGILYAYGVVSTCKECCKQEYAATHPSSRVNRHIDGLKQCVRCEQWKPPTTAFFHASKTTKDGLHFECKQCRSEAAKRRIATTPRIILPKSPFKTCTACKQQLPADLDHFHFTALSADRLQSECKTCSKVRHKAHYRKPEIQARQRVYGIAYRQRKREDRQAYYERRRDYLREQARARAKRYRMEGKATDSRKRAAKLGVAGTYTPAQIQEQLHRQKFRCYYLACGQAKFQRIKQPNGKWKYIFEVDHTFPLSRVAGTDIPANDISYLVLACPKCNRQKQARYPHEWIAGGRLL